MSETAPRTRADSPYRGLMPYTEQDARYFFGRETESDLIISNLLSSRLTLLYGPSGVGKSSVLRAGVACRLAPPVLPEGELVPSEHETDAAGGEPDPPEYVLVVFSDWSGDPVAGLVERVRKAFEGVLPPAALAEPSEPGLVAALKAWTEPFSGDLLLILDQFEEYFVYHPDESGPGTFAEEFPRVLSYGTTRRRRATSRGSTGHGAGGEGPEEQPEEQPLRVNVLLSFREDALAQLDAFKGRIPGLLDNYYRLGYLTAERAGDAILKPVGVYNETAERKVEVEPALVKTVLEEVRTGEVVLGDVGGGGRARRGELEPEDPIETPYLQLVMTRLWKREMELRSPKLRASTLVEEPRKGGLGGAETIVRTHLDEVLGTLSPPEKDVAARIFHHLVTPDGYKVAHSARALASFTEVPEERVGAVLRKLEQERREDRILREVPAPDPKSQLPRYEIYHDRLAPAILSWRARYLVQAGEKTLKRTIGALVPVLAVVLLLALYAGHKAREAGAARLVADLQRDTVAQVLSNLASLYRGAGAVVSPDGRYVVSISKTGSRLSVRDLLMGTVVLLPRELGPVTAAALDSTGHVLAVGNEAGAVRLVAFPELRQTAELRGHTAQVNEVLFGERESLLATASDDRTVRIWDVATGSELAVYRYERPVAELPAQFRAGDARITALAPKGGLAGQCVWAVVVGSDRTPGAAADEVRRAARSGFDAALYYRDGWYGTTVGPYCARAEADSARSVLGRTWPRPTLPPIDLTTWCPHPIWKPGYTECLAESGPP